MKREIILTKDGTATIEIPEWQVTYHSRHGAVQESMHVFVDAGLNYTMEQFNDETLYVFEMGFGTGLNAWLTLQQAREKQRKINYVALEKFPLNDDEVKLLNYTSKEDDFFFQLHSVSWNRPVDIMPSFTLQKENADLITYTTTQLFHLVYYDAFAPLAQPELWTSVTFEKLYSMMQKGGILVTYCSKGDVRRAMQAAGFRVSKLKGPPGKREMVRAEKA